VQTLRGPKAGNMKRIMQRALLGAVLAAGVPLAAAADELSDAIIAQLRAQGYEQVEFTSTLLGRYRFIAYGGDRIREIVFNPATGEILRDYSRARDDDDDAIVPRLVDRFFSTDDREDDDDRDDDGRDDDDRDDDDRDDDDRDDDDRDDDDRDDDNSGSGSSGSGSGSDDDDRDDDDDDDDDDRDDDDKDDDD
jgi:hypothetical protein